MRIPTDPPDAPDVPTAPATLTPADATALAAILDTSASEIASLVVRENIRLRARVAELEAEREVRERVLHGRIADLTARLSACLDCLPAGITGGPTP